MLARPPSDGEEGLGKTMTVTEAVEAQNDTPEEAAFRAEARAFLEANAQPRRELSPWHVNFHTDPEAARAEFEHGRAWQKTLFDHGFAGLTYPVEYGGRGGQAWHERIYREEAAQFDASSGFVAATIAMLGPTLTKHGTDEQKRELLPRLLSGEHAYCQLFSEPGAGSDLAGLACKAVRDGDEFVVTGQKVWNSAAQFCNRGMLLVRTDPDMPKHRGITFLLVDMDRPGIEVRPLVQATGAAHFNEVFLESVRIPVANVLGAIDEGWGPARTVMSNESAFIGGGQGGSHDRLLTLARRFGRADDPIVRQELARNYTRERLLAVMGERILAAVRERKVPPMDPSILKLFIAQNKVVSGNLAVALAGPAGVVTIDETSPWIQAELVNRYGISIGGGTNEVQRNNLAERALGLPREPRTDHQLPWKDIPRS
jgi:alkylation response protein AidB-like acyl-CoA dehydrogenase